MLTHYVGTDMQTMLVEKTAAEAGLTLLALSPGTILSKWWASLLITDCCLHTQSTATCYNLPALATD